MTRGYSNYKVNTNSRGRPSGAFATPKPKYKAKAAADSGTDIGKRFAEICQQASKKIQELREKMDPSVIGLPDQVQPTARQYRRYRNGHGLACRFSR